MTKDDWQKKPDSCNDAWGRNNQSLEKGSKGALSPWETTLNKQSEDDQRKSALQKPKERSTWRRKGQLTVWKVAERFLDGKDSVEIFKIGNKILSGVLVKKEDIVAWIMKYKWKECFAIVEGQHKKRGLKKLEKNIRRVGKKDSSSNCHPGLCAEGVPRTAPRNFFYRNCTEDILHKKHMLFHKEIGQSIYGKRKMGEPQTNDNKNDTLFFNIKISWSIQKIYQDQSGGTPSFWNVTFYFYSANVNFKKAHTWNSVGLT